MYSLSSAAESGWVWRGVAHDEDRVAPATAGDAFASCAAMMRRRSSSNCARALGSIRRTRGTDALVSAEVGATAGLARSAACGQSPIHAAPLTIARAPAMAKITFGEIVASTFPEAGAAAALR